MMSVEGGSIEKGRLRNLTQAPPSTGYDSDGVIEQYSKLLRLTLRLT